MKPTELLKYHEKCQLILLNIMAAKRKIASYKTHSDPEITEWRLTRVEVNLKIIKRLERYYLSLL